MFVAAALVTVAGGIRLSRAGDVLADRTGLGEAVFGAVLFGAVISASGIVMSATAAASDQPRLAYSNAVGGIAAQTAALAVADSFHRGVNLEHAAASLPNVMSAVLLLVMLTLAVLISYAPDWHVGAIHPGSIAMLGVYVYGLHLVNQTRTTPAWLPRRTSFTVSDEPADDAPGRSNRSLWLEFVALGLLVSGGGWAVARATESFVVQGGMQATLAGAALMGVVNAAPETVTSIAAVKRGALTMAMASVLGGNAFDVLNLVIADVAFRGGSIYHAAGAKDVMLALSGSLMTAVLLAGMLRRQLRGPGSIGFEGALVLGLYVSTLALIALGG